MTYDMATAMSEGWLLADDDVRGLEIQKYDEDPLETFESDEEALSFVMHRADQGSPMHQTVLRIVAHAV